MNEIALVPIAWIRTAAAAFAVLAFALALAIFARCAPAGPTLPPAVQVAMTAHEVASAVDTATVNRLEREKAAAKQRELAAARARQVAEDSARARGHRADSLEAVARSAATAADSATAWERAYYVRAGEVEDLQLALTDSKEETSLVRMQLASADSIAATWRVRAFRADTVIAKLAAVSRKPRSWGLGLAGGESCNDKGCGLGLTIGVVWRPF